MDLRLLSGGAANGLVTAVTADFTAETGLGISGNFGAVGGMRERFLGGEQVDLLILTRANIEALAGEGLVVAETIADLGKVVTGVARKSGSPPVDVSSSETLRAALAGADAIYCPDPKKATAGIHFARVLDRLGLSGEVAARLRLYPNGQTAMAAMAAGSDANPIGCTQITEILNTEGVKYMGALPGDLGLATVYTAAVSVGAAHPEAARRLIAILTAVEREDLRQRIGFSR